MMDIKSFRLELECRTSECPAFNLCNKPCTEVNLYKSAKSIDVIFIHSAVKKGETRPLFSPTGLALRRVIDYVIQRELKKPIGIAYAESVRSYMADEDINKGFAICGLHLYRDLTILKPKLIVTVGERAARTILNTPLGKFAEIRSVLTSTVINEVKYNVLPMLSAARLFETPIVIPSLIEDLRRALGVYSFISSMVSGESTKREEIKTAQEVKDFVDHLLYEVKTEAIAVDTEDKNLNRVYDNKMDSIQFCYDLKKAYFIWYCHPNTPFSSSDLISVKHQLQRLFTEKNVGFLYWIMHNAKFDRAILLSQLHIRPVLPVICTMTFPFILEENYIDSPYEGFGLKYLSKKYGFKGYSNKEVLDARNAGRLRDISTADFIKYATDDVIATLQLYYILKEAAKGQNYLPEAMRLMTSFYSRVHGFLVEMEHNGIVVDKFKLAKLEGPDSLINIEMDEILNVRIRGSSIVRAANQFLVENITKSAPLFGYPWIFDINKTKHKQVLFFKTLKLRPVSKSKSKNAITSISVRGETIAVGPLDKRFQETYSGVPEVKWLSEYSSLKKLKTSYIKSIRRFLDPVEGHADYYIDQKIRPEFSLMAKTGRARVSNPNSQQIPKGDTEARKEVRSIFCTLPGEALISLDYMGIEVRGWGILSRDIAMKKMFTKAKMFRDRWRESENPQYLTQAAIWGDIHTINASTMYGVPFDKVEKSMRSLSKTLTFGSIYGRSLKSIAVQLQCSEEEAQFRRDKAFSKFKEAGTWLINIEDEAVTNLYVTSPLGRRRRLWELLFANSSIKGVNDSEFWALRGFCGRARRQARNSPIQGFASDITLLAASHLLHNVILPRQKSWKFFNAVHDAVYLRVPISDIEECLYECERIFTSEIGNLLKQEFNYELWLPLEVEFEIGTHGGDLIKWDFSKSQLDKIIEEIKKRDSLKQSQKKDLYSITGIDLY